MKNRYKLLAAVAILLALSGVAAGQALATESLRFVTQLGFFPIKKVTLTTGGSGGIQFSQKGLGTPSECRSATGQGEITGPKTAKLKLTLKECATDTIPCHSTVGETGGRTITTETLPVELVYVSKEHHEAALDLNYEEPIEFRELKTFAKWWCNNGPIEGGPFGVRGSILAPITPVNTMALAHKLKLAKTGEAQTPSVYETEAAKRYEAFPETALEASSFWSKGAMTSGTELQLTTPESEGKVEIKA